jgi:GNAT superfamily N-acetyltransferase
MIQIATLNDYNYLLERDHHISKEMLEQKINLGEILIAKENQQAIGYLRYGYFWDNFPFMNLLFVEEAYRRKGIGRQLVDFWENQMKEQGHKQVMTSSLANEDGQFFYRKLGYKDAGSLLFPDEVLEVIFIKSL